MKYVVLLRGVNVGGKNKVSMQDLKQILERAGMHNVLTYINSGNVILESEKTTEEMKSICEAEIKKEFGFSVNVVVLDKATFLKITDSIPSGWVNNQVMRCEVMFLWQSVDSPDSLNKLTIKQDIDFVNYVPGAIIWMLDRRFINKSGMSRLIGTDIYKNITMRNCNTVRKIAELISS